MDRWDEPLMEAAKRAGALVGIWGAVRLIILPLYKAYKRHREKHPRFRKTVINTLKELQDGQRRFDDYNAALLRERIESAYTLYVVMMGWCPTGEKAMLSELFALLKERDWDYRREKYQQEIMALPVNPPKINDKKERE